MGGSPATDHQRFEPVTAPAYQLSAKNGDVVEASSTDDAIRLLVSLLTKGVSGGIENSEIRSSWDRRKALVCAADPYREVVARRLTENGYQVYVAEDTRQAIETMRGNQLQVVLLEPQFDQSEQGAAFVVREVNVLRPAQRRRLFFVLLSPSLRTRDAHSAFLNNVNAVVNINDLEELPPILDLGLREYNELYREFNTAFNLAAL